MKYKTTITHTDAEAKRQFLSGNLNLSHLSVKKRNVKERWNQAKKMLYSFDTVKREAIAKAKRMLRSKDASDYYEKVEVFSDGELIFSTEF